MTMRAAPGRVVAVLLLGSAGVLALAGGLVRAQVVASQQSFPRTADGKPDLSGIWQTISTANWDLEGHEARPSPVLALGAVGAVPPGLGVVEGGRIPYQGWAAAKKQENARNWLTKAPADFWMGWSDGRWEGDTLVIDVTSFNDQSWFDRAGNFHSDQLHVIERYTPVTPYHLAYEATIEDPKVFTRSWKISLPLYRVVDKNAQLLEFKCVELTEELLYGDLVKKPQAR